MPDQYEYFGKAVALMQQHISGDADARDDLVEVAEYLRERLVWGEEKYGSDGWLRHDMLEEYYQEQLDATNYCILKWMQIEHWRAGTELSPFILAEVRSLQEHLLARAELALRARREMQALARQANALGIPQSITGENLIGVQS